MAEILRVWGSFASHLIAFACQGVRILALMPCSFNGANEATWEEYMCVLKTEMNTHKHVLEVLQLSIQLSVSSCCLLRNIGLLQYFTEDLVLAKRNYLRRLKNRYDNEKDKARKNKTLEGFPDWNQQQAIDTTNKAFEKYKPVDGKDPIFLTGAFLAPRGSMYAYHQKRLKPV